MRSKNEMPYVKQALEKLSRQVFRDYALYNVDSGSTDGTLEVIQRFNPHPQNIIKIASHEYVPGLVLNMMIERTTEPIIVLLNADAIPISEHWLDRLLLPILMDEADATMSRQVARKCARFIDKYDYERAYSLRTLKRNPEFFSAVASAFRRTLWEETKFYTAGYAEDLAWSKVCQEKGARFKFASLAIVEHSHNFTIPELYRKRYRHGKAFVGIYGIEPSVAQQLLICGKEIVRDLVYALRKVRLDTIPYNIVYRIVIHFAYYRGIQQGQKSFSNNKVEAL